jgi:hypothetical protein
MKPLWIGSMILLIVVAVGVYQAVRASMTCDEYEIVTQRVLNNHFRENDRKLEERIAGLAETKGLMPMDLKIELTRGLRSSREIQTLIPDYRSYPLKSFVLVAVVEYKQRVLLFSIPLKFTAFTSYERSAMPGTPSP